MAVRVKDTAANWMVCTVKNRAAASKTDDCLGCCQLCRQTRGKHCAGIRGFACRKQYLEIPVFLD